MSLQGLDQGIVQNPYLSTQPVGTSPAGLFLGKNGEILVSEIHGKWATAARFGQLWSAAATGLTVPAITSGVVSVFSLYNSPSSSVFLELVDFDCGIILAAQLVDFIGLYVQAGVGSAMSPPTGVTVGTVQNGLIGLGGTPQGKFLSAATTVGVSSLDTILGTFGATTTTGDQPIHYEFDGKKLLPPGTLATICMSTAASTASGLALGLKWIEWPLG